MGDQPHEASQLEHSRQYLEGTRQQGAGAQIRRSVAGTQRGDDDAARPAGARTYARATTKGGGEESQDDGGPQPDEGVDPGDEGEADGLGDHGERYGETGCQGLWDGILEGIDVDGAKGLEELGVEGDGFDLGRRHVLIVIIVVFGEACEWIASVIVWVGPHRCR